MSDYVRNRPALNRRDLSGVNISICHPSGFLPVKLSKWSSHHSKSQWITQRAPQSRRIQDDMRNIQGG
jgi:hypothetical protein